MYKYVLSLCRNASLAEELTQETFFRALQTIDGFRGECRVYVWLCQIAKHLYFTSVRQSGRLVPEEEAPELPARDEPEADFLAGETGYELQRALHSLEEPYKEVLMLRIFGELPFSRIGQLFGKTENWARVTYHRGRLKCKEMLI